MLEACLLIAADAAVAWLGIRTMMDAVSERRSGYSIGFEAEFWIGLGIACLFGLAFPAFGLALLMGE